MVPDEVLREIICNVDEYQVLGRKIGGVLDEAYEK
jgi:hypothetical protein